MNLQELKQKNPAELINEAEKLGIENPSTLRKQEILFAILKFALAILISDPLIGVIKSHLILREGLAVNCDVFKVGDLLL